jgi:hypothetical protein
MEFEALHSTVENLIFWIATLCHLQKVAKASGFNDFYHDDDSSRFLHIFQPLVLIFVYPTKVYSRKRFSRTPSHPRHFRIRFSKNLFSNNKICIQLSVVSSSEIKAFFCGQHTTRWAKIQI